MATKAPLRLTAALALSVAGMGLMILQALEHIKVRSGMAGFESFCTIGKFDCIAIESSRYSEILPGYPLAAAAAAFYAALSVVLWFGRGAYWRREAIRLAAVMSGAGVLVSLIYLVIMITQIGTLCLFCLGQDAIALTVFVLVLSLKPESLKNQKIDSERLKVTLGAGGAAAFVVAIAFAMQTTSGDKIPAREVESIVSSVLTTAPTEIKIGANDPTIGPADAPITIVKFSDFQCPACKMGAFALHPVMQRYKGKIKFVFKNFPLDAKCNRGIQREMHPLACEAARISICANRSGKFEAVYHSFFQRQEELVTKGPAAIAKEAGFDGEALEKCGDSLDAKAAVNESIEQAMELGVQATPTFYVNGRKLAGGLPTDVWIKVIDALLAQGK